MMNLFFIKMIHLVSVIHDTLKTDNLNQIKRLITIFFPLTFVLPAAAQTEIGPEGHKLIWFFLGLAAAGILVFFGSRIKKGGRRSGVTGDPFRKQSTQKRSTREQFTRAKTVRGTSNSSFSLFQKPFFRKKRIVVELKKDRLYYPDYLKLIITNSGNTDVDIDTPLLIFSSIWVRRKFKLKGTNYSFSYPLYLAKGQNHTLTIDLERFYRFDKTLRRLPRVRVVVPEVNGKKLGGSKVLLRKTLFNI